MKKPINKNKKAVFFTLMTYFLISALLTMVFVTIIEPDVEKNLVLDRTYDLASSVEASIKEILNTYYDVNITIERYNSNGGVNITFTEEISREKDDWGQEFGEKIENFKTFVESEDENTKINTTAIKDKELPLRIIPHNITYSRYWGIGHVILRVNPQSINFNSYDIFVNSKNQEIDKVISQLRASGNFLFRVVAVDNYGKKFVEQKLVDPADSHQVQIFFVGGNKVKIDFVNNFLETWTNVPSKIDISTKIDGLVKMNEKTKIKLFPDAINVSFPSFDAEKIASINIEEE